MLWDIPPEVELLITELYMPSAFFSVVFQCAVSTFAQAGDVESVIA